MSELIFNSESLNDVINGREISLEQAIEIFQNSKNDQNELFEAASQLRKKFKGKKVTFSKKSFFNVINLCKDTCSYCTYKAEPRETKMSMMTENDVLQLSKLAKKAGCVEALFVTGERPELKYGEAKKWLKKNGFSSTPEYLVHCSEIALKEGLFPHTNAGNLTKSEMVDLKKTNASIGVMLENASERLTEKGMPHHYAQSKNPKERIKVLKDAGELKFPITTGLLVGIGETPNEIIESLFTLREIHKKYNHIQEIILQNFQPKQDTIMKNSPPAEFDYFKAIVALSRIIMPEMNIQIPPNLSPNSYQSFLKVGINDWGGISPLTPDFVNPEFAWPKIEQVKQYTNQAGYHLRCRFPVYPEFFNLVNKDLVDKMSQIKNDDGYVSEDYWN